MTVPWPDLTIVMPVRNEGAFMATSLDAVLAQDYPGRLEVLVADGASEDGTDAVIADRARADPRVTLVPNPDRIVSCGLNRAIATATGELVLRVDGHCTIPPDYARVCVARLLAEDSACVGGQLRTVGSTPVARGIALAQASPAGVGNATFRTGAAEVVEVDTVAFGVYRRDHLRALGGFDEDLVRNQDDELNLRVRQDGGRILLDPTVVVHYHSRASLRSLLRQYGQYGWFKPLVLRKRGRLPTVRSAVPGALVLGLALTTIAAGAVAGPLAALAPIALYGAGLVLVGLGVGRRDPTAALVVPAALGAMHLAYGIGFIGGLWRWRSAPPTPVRSADG